MYYVNPDIEPWIYIISITIMSVVGCVGLAGNIAIVIGYVKNSSVRLSNDYRRNMYLIFLKCTPPYYYFLNFYLNYIAP